MLEVVDAPDIHAVPDAPAAVLGVTAIHGRVVTVYDAHQLLHAEAGAAGALLVIDRGDRCVGLAVSDVLDTLDIAPGQLRPVPGMDAGDGVLQGVVRRDAELIAIIEADALIGGAMTQGEEQSG